MKLKKLSRYFYRNPQSLLKSTFVLSVFFHGMLFFRIPFVSFSALPAEKGDVTFINVNLMEMEPPRKIKEVVEKEEKLEETVPLAEKEEEQPEEEKVEEEKAVTPPMPSISEKIIIQVRKRYEDEVLERIHASKHYPMAARRMEQEGIVKVEFTVTREGRIQGNIHIIRPCRYASLNEAAVRTVRQANPFPVFPPEIRKNEMVFTVDIDFKLRIW